MLLHVRLLVFRHPATGGDVRIKAPLDDLFVQALQVVELEKFVLQGNE
ncbi:MAG: hypothetical protein JNJ90_14050 [Saprospiraceae bacterium]|jgi:hypothetical protein|nr:hypothetical protein [Saprospiraceae bacterium]